MNELDLDISEALTILASIVNRAGRSEATSAAAVPVCKVPTQLLVRAMRTLERWKDTEYTSEPIRQACKRLLD